MGAKIINRGRGPEIEGTRITVYDVLDYTKHGWHPAPVTSFPREWEKVLMRQGFSAVVRVPADCMRSAVG